MLHPKLVMIEGIPGSGKTSTARAVAEWLGARGFDARLFLEGNLEHPADFESVARISAKKFRDLLDHFPADRAALEDAALVKRSGEVLIAYRKLEDTPHALPGVLAENDIYNLPEADFVRLTLERWQSFAAGAAGGDGVYVFECCLLQNQLTTLIAVHDLPPERIRAQAAQIAQAIEPLDPLLIYLEPASIRAALGRVAAERPPAWLEYVAAYTCGQAWGEKRGLGGFEGMIAFYEARRDLEKALIAELFPLGLWIERAGADWAETRLQVEACLAERFGEVG